MHEKKLFFWANLYNKPGDSVEFVKRVYDGKIQVGENEDFYFMDKYDRKDPEVVKHQLNHGKPPTSN